MAHFLLLNIVELSDVFCWAKLKCIPGNEIKLFFFANPEKMEWAKRRCSRRLPTLARLNKALREKGSLFRWVVNIGDNEDGNMKLSPGLTQVSAFDSKLEPIQGGIFDGLLLSQPLHSSSSSPCSLCWTKSLIMPNAWAGFPSSSAKADNCAPEFRYWISKISEEERMGYSQSSE